MNPYDFDYFERGISTGKSGYENYRWIPELTIPMAMSIIDYLDIKRFQRVLDFGCAKGYLVKALRMLGRDAWGLDVSHYAINQVDVETKTFCGVCTEDLIVASNPLMPCSFEYGIAKDVFEHIEEGNLGKVLVNIPCTTLFVVVPLGNGEKYNVPAYQMDVTHITCQPLDWWKSLFEEYGWEVVRSVYRIEGIKDNWAMYEDGNGFFTLRRR